MKLEIVSPTGVIFQEEVAGFSIMTNSGKRTILERHVDFLSFFQFSEVEIIGVPVEETIYVALGYLYVSQGDAYIIAQLASHKEEKIAGTYKRIRAIQKGNAMEEIG